MARPVLPAALRLQTRGVQRARRDDGAVRQYDAQFQDATRTVHAAWHDSVTLSTTGWPEGAYLLRLEASAGHQRYAPLIVRSAGPQNQFV